MLYRKTRNRLLLSSLLLVLIICISTKSNAIADADISRKTYMPFAIINQADINGDSYDGDYFQYMEISERKDAQSEYIFDLDGLTTEKNTNTNSKILIYHTHTNEAYLENEENRFQNLASRSGEYGLTVKAVGDALVESFAVMGIDSDHDVTNNEQNGYSAAYKTSKKCIESSVESNGDYRVYIDLHRDAYVNNTQPLVEIDGESVARVMFVVGGKSKYASANNAFALKVADELNKIHPQLCKKVLLVQSSLYNQDVSDHCLLVEIGDNSVSVAEANRAAQYVAVAVARVLGNE